MQHCCHLVDAKVANKTHASQFKEYYQEDTIKSKHKKAAKIKGKRPVQKVSGLFPRGTAAGAWC